MRFPSPDGMRLPLAMCISRKFCTVGDDLARWFVKFRDTFTKENDVVMIKVSQIREGQPFRKPGQRKWRVAHKVLELPASQTLDKTPSILVCLADCSQVELKESDEVEIPDKPGDLDSRGFAKLGRRRSAERKRRSGEFR